MTSIRQLQANRRNALKSTGPKKGEGKKRSPGNAVRPGLTAEAGIGALEDAEDYKAFEAAIIADYDAQTAVERELVLRLASVLWRLRRATMMETGLFAFQADYVLESELAVQTEQEQRRSLYALFPRTDATKDADTDSPCERVPDSGAESARCFLGLAKLPSYPLDRLSRYEALLWRQARQIVFLLDTLGRRRPRERGRYFHHSTMRPPPFDGQEEI